MILNYILTHKKLALLNLIYMYSGPACSFPFPLILNFLVLFLELLESSRGRTGYKMRGCKK